MKKDNLARQFGELNAKYHILEKYVEEHMWVAYDLGMEDGWSTDGYTTICRTGPYKIELRGSMVKLTKEASATMTTADLGPPHIEFYVPHPGLAIGVAKSLREILYSIHEMKPIEWKLESEATKANRLRESDDDGYDC